MLAFGCFKNCMYFCSATTFWWHSALFNIRTKKFSSKKPKYVFFLGNLVISSICYSNWKLTLFLVSAKKLSIHLNFPVFLLLPIFSFTTLWSEKTLGMMTILSLSTCIVSYHSIQEIAHFMCACKVFFYFWLAECSVSFRSAQSIMSLKSPTFSIFCCAALSIIDLACVLKSITSFNSINVCFTMGEYSQSSLRWLDSGLLCGLNENAALLAQAFEH